MIKFKNNKNIDALDISIKINIKLIKCYIIDEYTGV
jgi:hypothetical protein